MYIHRNVILEESLRYYERNKNVISVHIEASLIRRVCFCQLFLEMGFHGIYTFSDTRKDWKYRQISAEILFHSRRFLASSRSSKKEASYPVEKAREKPIPRRIWYPRIRFLDTRVFSIPERNFRNFLPRFHQEFRWKTIDSRFNESLISLPFHSSTMDLVRGNELVVKGLLPSSIITIRKIKSSLPFPARRMSMIRSQLTINFFLL